MTSIFFDINLLSQRAMLLCLLLFLDFHPEVAQATDWGTATDSVPEKHSVVAARLCQALRFKEAELEIALALNDEAEAHSLYTWYVRGFIYKEIYKNEEAGLRQSPAREIAIESFFEAREMARVQPSDFYNEAPLAFLVNSYYNDAMRSASDFELINIDEPVCLFEKYSSALGLLNDTEKLNDRKSEFAKTRGMRFYALWTNAMDDPTLHAEAIICLEEALRIDSSDCVTRYNKAVVHYKMAEYDFGRSEPNLAQVHLDASLKLLVESEKVCKDNLEILKGLLNVYKILKNDHFISFYEQRISELLQSINQVKN